MVALAHRNSASSSLSTRRKTDRSDATVLTNAPQRAYSPSTRAAAGGEQVLRFPLLRLPPAEYRAGNLRIRLNLSGNRLNALSLAAVLRALPLRHIEGLDLSDNAFDAIGAGFVMDAFRGMSLRSLSLRGNAFGSSAAEQIIESFCQLRAQKGIGAKKSSTGDTKALSSASQRDKTRSGHYKINAATPPPTIYCLHELNLAACGLSCGATVERLCDAVMGDPRCSLRKLDLSYNRGLSERGASRALGRASKRNRCLRELSLAHTGISLEAMVEEIFSESTGGMASGPSTRPPEPRSSSRTRVHSWDLGKNTLSRCDLRAFCNLLRHSFTTSTEQDHHVHQQGESVDELRFLSLADHSFDSEHDAFFGELMMQLSTSCSPSSLTLDLSRCKIKGCGRDFASDGPLSNLSQHIRSAAAGSAGMRREQEAGHCEERTTSAPTMSMHIDVTPGESGHTVVFRSEADEAASSGGEDGGVVSSRNPNAKESLIALDCVDDEGFAPLHYPERAEVEVAKLAGLSIPQHQHLQVRTVLPRASACVARTLLHFLVLCDFESLVLDDVAMTLEPASAASTACVVAKLLKTCSARFSWGGGRRKPAEQALRSFLLRLKKLLQPVARVGGLRTLSLNSVRLQDSGARLLAAALSVASSASSTPAARPEQEESSMLAPRPPATNLLSELQIRDNGLTAAGLAPILRAISPLGDGVGSGSTVRALDVSHNLHLRTPGLKLLLRWIDEAVEAFEEEEDDAGRGKAKLELAARRCGMPPEALHELWHAGRPSCCGLLDVSENTGLAVPGAASFRGGGLKENTRHDQAAGANSSRSTTAKAGWERVTIGRAVVAPPTRPAKTGCRAAGRVGGATTQNEAEGSIEFWLFQQALALAPQLEDFGTPSETVVDRRSSYNAHEDLEIVASSGEKFDFNLSLRRVAEPSPAWDGSPRNETQSQFSLKRLEKERLLRESNRRQNNNEDVAPRAYHPEDGLSSAFDGVSVAMHVSSSPRGPATATPSTVSAASSTQQRGRSTGQLQFIGGAGGDQTQRFSSHPGSKKSVLSSVPEGREAHEQTSPPSPVAVSEMRRSSAIPAGSDGLSLSPRSSLSRPNSGAHYPSFLDQDAAPYDLRRLGAACRRNAVNEAVRDWLGHDRNAVSCGKELVYLNLLRDDCVHAAYLSNPLSALRGAEISTGNYGAAELFHPTNKFNFACAVTALQCFQELRLAECALWQSWNAFGRELARTAYQWNRRKDEEGESAISIDASRNELWRVSGVAPATGRAHPTETISSQQELVRGPGMNAAVHARRQNYAGAVNFPKRGAGAGGTGVGQQPDEAVVEDYTANTQQHQYTSTRSGRRYENIVRFEEKEQETDEENQKTTSPRKGKGGASSAANKGRKLLVFEAVDAGFTDSHVSRILNPRARYLQIIDLRNNTIGLHGAKVLARGLDPNKLEALLLDGNKVGTDGVQWILDVFAGASGVVDGGGRSTDPTSTRVVAQEHHTRQGQKLKVLSFRDNDVRHPIARVFADFVARCCCVREYCYSLDFSDNREISHAEALRMLEVLLLTKSRAAAGAGGSVVRAFRLEGIFRHRDAEQEKLLERLVEKLRGDRVQLGV